MVRDDLLWLDMLWLVMVRYDQLWLVMVSYG